MASPPSSEASEIRRRGRQRLIGAVAIALLLIVFVPMLLDSEPRSARQEPKLDIPAKENAPPLPAPRADAAPGKPAPPLPPTATVEVKPDAKPEPSAPKAAETKPAPKVAAVEPKAAPAAAAKGAARMEGFAVQVGAYRDELTLQQTREKLTAANIATYTEKSGDLTRLRVGPFPTRDAAEKSLAVVRKSVPDAKVVPLP